jgi:NhaP-type Na+/H+ or K+/H+ antiporter
MIILGVFVLLVFLFSLVSKRVQKSFVSGPMVFTLAGILMYFVFPELYGYEVMDKTVKTIGEITLAVVIFSEASRISLRQARKESDIPGRLLIIGMPLTIIAGTLIAVLMFSDFSLWEAAVLAAILAPTDASLGAAVVNSPKVPWRIRHALTVEGGLNDGLSIPFLMLFIALARTDAGSRQTSWVVYTMQQIGFGILVGVALGWIGGKMLTYTDRRGWMENHSQQLALLSLAILSWWLGEYVLHGNGFIAAFIAGVMVYQGFQSADIRMADFDENWGDMLIYFVFFIFGTIAATDLVRLSLSMWMYAALSLTFIRLIPIVVSMIGTRLQTPSVLFMGWFGPRGLASIVLGLIFLGEQADIPGEATITMVVIATVMLSVFVHGASAVPAINVYDRKIALFPDDAVELQEPATAAY